MLKLLYMEHKDENITLNNEKELIEFLTSKYNTQLITTFLSPVKWLNAISKVTGLSTAHKDLRRRDIDLVTIIDRPKLKIYRGKYITSNKLNLIITDSVRKVQTQYAITINI